MSRADRGRFARCFLHVACWVSCWSAAVEVRAADAVDIGSHRQLFLDAGLVESRRGVEFVMNRPHQSGDVLIQADQPWEQGGIVYLYSSVLKDGDLIRVWYDLYRPIPGETYHHQRWIGYAESANGVDFTKPQLGLHQLGGSTANNVVLPGVIGGGAVWIDPYAAPEHRYKTQAKVYPSGQFHMHGSPDGLHWSFLQRMAVGGPYDTQSIIVPDPASRRYSLYTRHRNREAGNYRMVRRLESADLQSWDNQSVVLEPDEMDRATYQTPAGQQPVDYYGATVFQYEGLYVMLAQCYWHFFASPANELNPATFDVQLLVSRDGKRFERLGGRAPFLRLGPNGRFDSRMIWALPNPIVSGDEIWCYYAGVNFAHNDSLDPQAPQGQKLGGIGRAVLRRDGFVSADAGYAGGELVTRPVRFTGEQLELNLDTSAGGGVRLELLDENSAPIAGFSGDDAPWTVGNSVHLPVAWNGSRALKELEGKAVRLRFHLRNCKLYAFQFKSGTP